MSTVYQHVGSLATTAYVTKQGEGPRGNFEDDGSVVVNLLVETAMIYVSTLGGGEIVIGAGDFSNFNGDIDFQGNNIILRGMGYGTYIHHGQDAHLIQNGGYDYCSITNMRLAQTSSGNFVDVINWQNGSDYFRFEKLWITDSDRYGILFGGTNIIYGWILNCFITGVGDYNIIGSMTASNTINYVTVVGNIIVGGLRSFIITNFCNSAISGNIMITPTWEGFQSGGANQFNVISNNVIYDSGLRGFSLAYGNGRSLIESNVIYSPGSDGIYITETDYYMVSNNLIYDPYDDGIEFDDADYCLCMGNTIYSSGDDGIIFAAGATMNQWHCVGNTIIDATGIGISYANCNYELCANNMIYNPGESGILASSYSSMINNYIYSSGQWGIFINSDSLCAGNYVYQPAWDGILVISSNNAIIGNYIYDGSQYGIELYDANADDNVVTRNWTRGNTSGCVNISNVGGTANRLWMNNFDEGNITDAGTNTTAFDNYDPSANAWIAMIGAGAIGGAR